VRRVVGVAPGARARRVHRGRPGRDGAGRQSAYSTPGWRDFSRRRDALRRQQTRQEAMDRLVSFAVAYFYWFDLPRRRALYVVRTRHHME
jgi:hypothetical protein